MQAARDYPNTKIKQQKLTKEEMENMPVNLKTKYKPLATFWEYLCPTNNTTYMVYIPETNPFSNYDFREDIPSYGTRKHAATDPK